MCGWLTVRIMGLHCFSVTESVQCFSRVELIVLNVARYVTHAFPCGGRHARFVCRLVVGLAVVSGLRLVTNLAVVIICSMLSCQLAHALLMSQCEVVVRGVRSASCGLGMRFR